MYVHEKMNNTRYTIKCVDYTLYIAALVDFYLE